MNCSLLIKQIQESMTESEKKIAEYVLNNPGDVYKFSANQLGMVTETSAASVVRFAKKLGFDGLQEFKIALAKDDNITTEDVDYEYINTDDTIKEVMVKISNKNIKSINDTVVLLDEKKIEEAVRAIQNAKNIYIFGVGQSALIGMDLQYKLSRIRKNALMNLDSHLQISIAANMSEDDVAIGISYSGKTKEVYNALSKSKEKGAKCITITKFGDNPVASLGDINIQVPGVEKDLRVGAISSRIAQLTIIDILFIGVAKDNFPMVDKYLKETRNMVEDLKLK
ncbi:transcriptional regulator, RpiR family [Clostridium cavendishii DSM 21758]|uniref:Transcriptional regulator, RpiR family n=1 Tax=Clostridium cavendishii DSM 21758 TaxID=1121302 RepID=A0A1M6UPM2_9CLOT|nr:MurR/RpiR family transcriptional regulator [Clostridium cavendishii]SHK71157.1 transcriptional regulator, RpiR family [Clostridium cavendishii DSM 21758]